MARLGDLLDLGKFLKPLAAINLPKSPTFLGNFCKGVKIFHFSSEIIFGQLLWTFGIFSVHTDSNLYEGDLISLVGHLQSRHSTHQQDMQNDKGKDV